MGQYQNYAGTLNDVQRVAKNLTLGGGGRLENVQSSQVLDFIHDADSTINSILSSCYQTPLVQITRDGETFFPHPISNIARRIAASYLVQSVYSEVDQNVSANAEKYGAQAIQELESLVYGVCKGDRSLPGQRAKSRVNFANPNSLPREHMPSPRTTL